MLFLQYVPVLPLINQLLFGNCFYFEWSNTTRKCWQKLKWCEKIEKQPVNLEKTLLWQDSNFTHLLIKLSQCSILSKARHFCSVTWNNYRLVLNRMRMLLLIPPRWFASWRCSHCRGTSRKTFRTAMFQNPKKMSSAAKLGWNNYFVSKPLAQSGRQFCMTYLSCLEMTTLQEDWRILRHSCLDGKWKAKMRTLCEHSDGRFFQRFLANNCP